MNKLFKKASILSVLFIATTLSAYAKSGTTCRSHDAYFDHSQKHEFYCKDIQSDPLTIKEIYDRNYQVVTSYRVNKTVLIVIEEQD